MTEYTPQQLDRKWQQQRTAARSFEVDIDPARPKYYCLEMFAYPSGHAHVGSCPQLYHWRRDGEDEAYAWLQGTASVPLGCVRPSGGKRGHQDGHASGDLHA